VLCSDRRVYDVLVTDRTGTPLCNFQGLTLQRHVEWQAPLPIHYDLGYQAVATAANFPPIAAHFAVEDADKQRLYTTLDKLASKIISQGTTLELPQNLSVR
jgi:hypothetical protein